MRVKIRDIEFSSPLLTASGTYGYGHEVEGLAEVNQWGGIITKSNTTPFFSYNSSQLIICESETVSLRLFAKYKNLVFFILLSLF